jgi:hypothetical protein
VAMIDEDNGGVVAFSASRSAADFMRDSQSKVKRTKYSCFVSQKKTGLPAKF